MELSKRGQSANKVGTMIILITIVLLLYLLFLPPANRDQILYNDSDPTGNFSGTDIEDRLLDVSPGDLEYVSRDKQRYSIPAYTVSSEFEGVELFSEESFIVQRSLFSERQRSYRFQATPSLTEDVILSFTVDDARGTLTVTLNNETLYTGTPTQGNIPPIRIDSDELRSQNTVRFETNPPGLAFWSTNQYQISNARITAQVKDTKSNQNYQSAYIPADDYNRIERAEVEYIASCDEDDVNDFELAINDFLLFEGTPDCALVNRKEFDPGALVPGQNDITTRVNGGSVLVDKFTLTTYYEDTETKTYYFELKDKYFVNTTRSPSVHPDYYVNATYTFAGDENKQFNAFINGRRRSITTDEASVSQNITRFVKPGTNAIRVEPRNDFTMPRLTVDLSRR